MDLISMYGEVDHNPLLSLMNHHMKFWVDQSSLAEESESSAKRQRMAPSVTDMTPATEALEQFLRFAIEETPLPLPMDDDCSTSSDGDLGSTSSSKSSFSSLYKSKCNYRFTSVNEVTRGMAEISHH
jgi:hypothetical protein